MEEKELKKEMRFQKRILLGVFLVIVLPVLIWIAYTIYNYAPNCWGTNEDYNDLEITQFNGKFIEYNGEKLGSQVEVLLKQVLENNKVNEKSKKVITVRFNNDGEIITKENPTNYTEGWSINSKLKPNKKYNVKFEYVKKGGTKGLINKIKINEVNENG